MHELKIYRGVIMCHDNGEWCKIWRGIDLSFQNWHGEFDKFWLKHLEVSKTFTLMCSFWAEYILFELKKYRGVIFHDTEEWYKIWRGIDMSFQNWHGEFDEFWPEHLKISKILTLMDSFWAEYILFELKKYRGVIFHDTERWYKIWRGIDLSFQNWQDEFDIVWLGGLKNFPFNGLLLSKVYIVWAKKCRGVILHDIEEWYKIWSGINLSFENWHEEFHKFWPDHLKVSKIFTLMDSFWAKYILSELKKCRSVIFHDTEEWYKIRRGIDLLCVSKLTWGIWQILTWALESLKKMSL